MADLTVCHAVLPCTDEELSQMLEAEEHKQSTSLVITHSGVTQHENFVEFAINTLVWQIGFSLAHLTIDFDNRYFIHNNTHAHFLDMLLTDLVSQLESLTLKNFNVEGMDVDIQKLGLTIGKLRGNLTIENIRCHPPNLCQHLWWCLGWNNRLSLSNMDWDEIELDLLKSNNLREVVLKEVTTAFLMPFFDMLANNTCIESLKLEDTELERTDLVSGVVSVLKSNQTITSVSFEVEAVIDTIQILRFLQNHPDESVLKHLAIRFTKNVLASKKAMHKLMEMAKDLVKSNRTILSLRFIGRFDEDLTAGFDSEVSWHLKLNRIGRKSLMDNVDHNHNDWFNALVENADDPSTSFYLLTKNPPAFSSVFKAAAKATDDAEEAVVSTKRQRVS